MSGKAGSEDDGYSDDDLDALGSEDFLELQEQALQATQHRDAPHQLQHLLLRGQPISQSEVDLVTKDSTTSPPPRLPRPGRQATNHEPSRGVVSEGSSRPSISQPQGPTDEVAQQEQWRLQRFGPQNNAGAASQASSTTTRHALPHRVASQEVSYVHLSHDDVGGASTSKAATDQRIDDNLPQGDVELPAAMKQLLLEKERLVAENTSLERTLKVANDQLQVKSGEIAILRSNHAKQVQDREKILEDLKRQQRLQDDRHHSELEQVRKEKEKLVIQNRFLDHENSERAWQSRASKKSSRGLTNTDNASTPKRPKGPGFGDGFEDSELETMSPSKAGPKPKATTPKAGAKRKRDILNLSPMTSFGVPLGESESYGVAKASPRSEVRPTSALPPSAMSARSDFLHKLLFHRRKSDETRTFEKTAGFVFPSHSTLSLAELFMDKIPPNHTATTIEDVPASYGSILLELWSQCLAERYYRPIGSLIDLIRFVLLNGTTTTAIHLLDDIVSLAQRTADINVIPRFKKLNKNAKVISLHLDDQALESSKDVDTQQCLQLLYLTAMSCARDHNAVTRFWHCMRFDFISMVLRIVQTLDDIVLMVRLLRTCVEHDCFDAIKPQSPEGGSAEQHVIDRLTSMLIEIPRPLENDEPYDIADILRLRLIILGLGEKMCEQKLCSRAFATHPLALGRLVRVMNDELNAIYTSSYCLASRSQIVNRSIRILFYLTSTYPQEIDLQDKLRRQPGGVNKFLITLSRLAFSDAVWYERGISEDVFDCAHQLLEDFVTPEEAEALKKAFIKDDN